MSSGTAKITSFFKPVTDSVEDKHSSKVQPLSTSSNIENEANVQSPPSTAFEKENVKNVKEQSKENDFNAVNTNTTPSKRKAEDLEDEDKRVSPSCISPEQKDRMVSNKVRAKVLRASRALPLISSNIGSSWFSALEPQFSQNYFIRLSEHVTRERESHTVFPSREEVWSWTTRTEIQDTKVVILGQDPYHGPGQAHGLCFSVKPGVPPPPSLVNIFKELEADIPGFKKPGHGCLAGWADQGVLLLNACLTVRRGEANSHKARGWEQLTDAVVRWVSLNCEGVVFLLWGLPAQKKAAVVDGKKHHLLKTVHPSPLSAYRGFLGCRHFSECNRLLEAQGKKPIDWSYLPEKL